MGLLDPITNLFSSETKLKRLSKKLTEKFGPPENRAKAIETLADLGTPEALSTLLLRFTIVSDSRITDAEEKEAVFHHLVDAAEDALPPLKEFLRQKDQVAWPLKVLSELLPQDEVLALVLEELLRLGQEYARDPEKRVQLITWLLQHHPEADPRIAPALIPFLADRSDDVKLVTVRGLADHKDETAREPLLAALLDPEQSARVRQELTTALAQLEFGVQGHREQVEKLLADTSAPYTVDKAGLLQKR